MLSENAILQQALKECENQGSEIYLEAYNKFADEYSNCLVEMSSEKVKTKTKPR